MNANSPAIRTAPVLVPMPADKPYSYAILPGMKVRPGSIVRVPLGPREVAGIVWDGDGGGVDPLQAEADLAKYSTARRSTATCAASSTGLPPIRCRRPAWSPACC